MLRMPPREKIHEALSAIADNRIVMSDNTAEVSSSERNKKYTVTWNDNIYSSNDNATYWQGYPGYPLIGVLILQNKINFDKSIIEHFKNIRWKEINKMFKNNYTKSVESVYEDLMKNGVNVRHIEDEIDSIYDILEGIDIIITKGTKFPPK